MDLFSIFVVVLLGKIVAALKLLRIDVPTHAFRNSSVKLECSYDLGADKLYGVSWYKDNEEFYRYIQQDNVQHTYHVDGVTVNTRNSRGQRVQLDTVKLQSKGLYKCEISAEAPSFNSVRSEAYMEVIVLPQEGPTITGEEKIYASGDILALNCTSAESHPAAYIKWFINGQEVSPDSEEIIERRGLFRTKSSVRIELGPNHLSKEQISVRCEAGVRLGPANRKVGEPLIEFRNTEVFVQGEGSLVSPSIFLVATALLHHVFRLP